MDRKVASVPWSFPTSHAHLYLKPFISRVFPLESFYENWNEIELKLSKPKNKEEFEKTWYLYLNGLAEWLCSRYVRLTTIQEVINEFIVKTMPLANKLLREMFTQYIPSETWQETLVLFTGKKEKSK